MALKDPIKQAAYLREWRHKNKDSIKQKLKEYYKSSRGYNISRNCRLKKMYGITLQQYEEMVLRQNGLCAICGKPELCKKASRDNKLSVDHNHSTGQVRKLLCINCNRGLGAFFDNIIIMERAIQYIKDHQ